MEAQEICSVCLARFTPFICCCSDSAFRICEACLPAHKEKYAGVQHDLILYPYGRPNDQGLYLARRKLLDLSVGVKRSLATLSALEATVGNQSESLIHEIQTHRDKVLETLRDLRTQGEKSVSIAANSAKIHVLDQAYVPIDPVERLLFNYSPGVHPDPQIFNLTTTLPYEEMRRTLNTSVNPSIRVVSSLIDVGSGVRDHSVAVFNERELHIFDCDTLSWTGFCRLSQDIPTFGRVNVFLPDGNLFHCGGSLAASSLYLSNAYKIDCSTGQISDLSGMSTPRRSHGGVRDGFFIYVFGGKCENTILKSAEKYEIAGDRWEALPEMKKERMNFNPVLRNGRIYLFGGCVKECEEFDIARNEFSLLTFSLQEASPTTSVNIGPEELMVFSSLYVHTWNQTTNAFASTRANINGATSTEMVPIFVNYQVYSPGWKGLKVLTLPSLLVDSIPIPPVVNH